MVSNTSAKIAASLDLEYYKSPIGSLFFARAVSDLYHSDCILILENSDGTYHAMASVGADMFLSLRGCVPLGLILSGNAVSALDFSYNNVHHVPISELFKFIEQRFGVVKKQFTPHKAVCREWLRNNAPLFETCQPGGVVPLALVGVSTRLIRDVPSHFYLMQRVDQKDGVCTLSPFMHTVYPGELLSCNYIGFISVPGWYYKK